MLCAKREIGTLTTLTGENCMLRHESVADRYRKCGLLNIIQHIDICGRSSYSEKNRSKIHGNDNDVFISSISSSARTLADDTVNTISDSSVKNVDSKLSRFSITTKVSGLYPGHDILSKRSKKNRLGSKNYIFGAFVPR